MTDTKETTHKVKEASASKGNRNATGASSTMETILDASADALNTNYEKFVEYGNENVAAVIEANKIAADGFEEIAGVVLSGIRVSMEDGLAASRELAGCKDLKTLVDCQNTHARKAMDDWLSQSKKLSELSLKVVAGAMEPLGRRVNANFEGLTRRAS